MTDPDPLPAPRRNRAVRRVLWITLVLNLAVAAGKLGVGYSVNSLAMIADGFHSVMDSASNVIGLVGVSVASRPPDPDHPYGHHKFEPIAALGIAILLGLTAFEVLSAAVERLGSGIRPEPTALSFAVMGVTMAVNAGVSWYEARAGHRWNSEVLLADAGHTRSDVGVSASVLAGLAAAWLELYWVDLLAAGLIAGLILRVGYGVLRRVLFALTDSTSVDPAQIDAEARAVAGVLSTSRVRSRGRTPYLFVDLEIQLPADLSLQEAHDVAERVRRRCMDAFGARDVVVHMEPAPPLRPEAARH